MKRTIVVACAALLAAVFLLGAKMQRTEYSGAAIYANNAGAVFYVRAMTAEGKLKTSGSGFTVSADGLALTAAHVIRGADKVHVVLPDGKELADVEVVERDDLTDVAVLRLPARKEAYPFLKLEQEQVDSGEAVYVIGYPLKTVKLIHDGIVSAPTATINGVERLLISAELASGMSGGPVICQHGAVVGLASATVRTMNGVSASPATAQLREAVARCQTQGNSEGAMGK